MANRFFKLIYVIALILIALSLPIYFFSNVDFSKITISTYKAKCTSNDQYVVLEGSSSNSQSQAYTFDETSLDNPLSDTKEDLNFYCKYYDQIQPYLNDYAASTTTNEQKLVNLSFYQFKNSQDTVYAYPQLYKLETVSERKNYNEVLYTLMAWFGGALAAFVILQILKISYLYVKFGEIVWHPFKSSRKK